MEFSFSSNGINLKKELNSLDKFAIDFTSILNRLSLHYVVVSGYVSIIFGRSRSSEDIDIIIEKLDFDNFKILLEKLKRSFECIITNSAEEAYFGYLNNGHSVRFARKGEFIPNIEIKFPKTELDKWSLDNSQKVSINDNKMHLSKIELQIPYKLFLGSDKDIEDAKFLYKIFKNKIDLSLMNQFNKKLNVGAVFEKYLEKL